MAPAVGIVDLATLTDLVCHRELLAILMGMYQWSQLNRGKIDTESGLRWRHSADMALLPKARP